MSANFLPFWSFMVIGQVWLASGHWGLALVCTVTALAALAYHEWLYARGHRE